MSNRKAPPLNTIITDMPPSEKEDLYRKILEQSYVTDDGHRLWQGNIGSAAPIISLGGVRRATRRVFYMLATGAILDEKVYLRRQCSEWLCIEPDHHRTIFD